ncbi:MAG: efflux RND transporter permease subunit, partial [Candidatus Pacebacteria bacterium]|nr:efflux RND transporter permease subunit [Candidatus Paceibacterota bacterium]
SNIGGDIENTNKTTLDMINSLTIETAKGDIPLSTFTNSYLHGGVNTIQHQDGKRIVNVSADVQNGYTVSEIVSQFKDKIKEKTLPSGYEVAYGGEQEDMEKSFGDMYRAFILGVIAIFALLVFEFNSYRQPIFLLMTIPLAIIGILPGLTIAGQALSFPAIIGIIALGGVVVNHAIILIDRIHLNRKNGMVKEEAIVEAGKSRLKPIFLTTIITILGSVPLAFSSPVWAPIALAMIFGLSFSFVLTLGFVPVLYKKFGEDVID